MPTASMNICIRFYQQMNSIGLTCVDGEDQDRHLIDMPHAAFARAAGAAWQISRQSTAIWACTLCRWAQNADGLCYYDIVRGGMDKGVALPTCAKRWA